MLRPYEYYTIRYEVARVDTSQPIELVRKNYLDLLGRFLGERVLPAAVASTF